MKDQFLPFIEHHQFPCIMARALLKTGHIEIYQAEYLMSEKNFILKKMYQFITHYRKHSSTLHSFIITLQNHLSFNEFEKTFWIFLRSLRSLDAKHFPHDPQVSPDPRDPHFSYSIKAEAFFTLMLHPDSPRLARRFSKPAIVFNPHRQFEDLRARGIYEKVKKVIRRRDYELQKKPNPMLNDFGQISEVYQYTGREHSPHENLADLLGSPYEYHQSTQWTGH